MSKSQVLTTLKRKFKCIRVHSLEETEHSGDLTPFTTCIKEIPRKFNLILVIEIKGEPECLRDTTQHCHGLDFESKQKHILPYIYTNLRDQNAACLVA